MERGELPLIQHSLIFARRGRDEIEEKTRSIPYIEKPIRGQRSIEPLSCRISLEYGTGPAALRTKWMLVEERSQLLAVFEALCLVDNMKEPGLWRADDVVPKPFNLLMRREDGLGIKAQFVGQRLQFSLVASQKPIENLTKHLDVTRVSSLRTELLSEFVMVLLVQQNGSDRIQNGSVANESLGGLRIDRAGKRIQKRVARRDIVLAIRGRGRISFNDPAVNVFDS